MSTTNNGNSQYTEENFWKGMAALTERMNNLSVEAAERWKRIEAQSAETDKKIAELSVKIAAQSANLDKLSAETDKRIAETDKRIAAMDMRAAAMDMRVDKVISGIGKLTNSLGYTAEHILLNGLEKKFVDYGLLYNESIRNYFMINHNRVVGEIDMLLKGDNDLMNAETKWHPSTGDVAKLVKKQMPKIREYFNNKGDYRKLHCAIAGFQIDEKVLEFATKSGVFVIQTSENAIKVCATPKSFQPRGW
jgi:hypothetical protein